MATSTNVGGGWIGWSAFGGILMVLTGIAQGFLGITALVNKQYLFLTGNNSLVLNSQHTVAWGWVQLVLGVLVLGAGFSLLHASNWARAFASVFVAASFLVSLAFLSVFPVWAVILLVLDVLMLYSLVVRGLVA
jgi:hypothetical protein